MHPLVTAKALFTKAHNMPSSPNDTLLLGPHFQENFANMELCMQEYL